MPVPYVPTAVFNTPLPSSGRRGGRAARGGRDGGRSAAVVGGSPDKPSSPGTKHPTSADRGRNEQGARANSLPAQARRSNSIDAAKSGDPRKTSQPASRGPKGADDGPAGKENFPRSRDAKPFQKNNEFGMRDNVRNPRLNVDGPRRFENGPKSADAAGFQGDYKDNHFRESRADRGRGGHRGRGHPGYPGSHNQFTHMQHPFSHPKSFGFNDRQRAVPNGSQGPRVPLRSPSLQNSTMYGVYPFPADINTMYGYPPMQSGPMSAVPYQQYMEPFSLMSMISMQL